MRIRTSNATEDAKLIGAQDTIGSGWQFEGMKGADGPGVRWKVVATAIFHRGVSGADGMYNGGDAPSTLAW